MISLDSQFPILNCSENFGVYDSHTFIHQFLDFGCGPDLIFLIDFCAHAGRLWKKDTLL